jgi:hypothetical protein
MTPKLTSPNDWECGWLGCLRGIAICILWLGGTTGGLLLYAWWYMAQH